jgi:hypothetical protein
MELDEFKATRVAKSLEQVGIRIHHYSHAIDLSLKRADPVERFLQINKPLGTRVKIEAQRIHPSLDAELRIRFVGDAANFNANAP